MLRHPDTDGGDRRGFGAQDARAERDAADGGMAGQQLALARRKTAFGARQDRRRCRGFDAGQRRPAGFDRAIGY